jgi:hypothetical protein
MRGHGRHKAVPFDGLIYATRLGLLLLLAAGLGVSARGPAVHACGHTPGCSIVVGVDQ